MNGVNPQPKLGFLHKPIFFCINCNWFKCYVVMFVTRPFYLSTDGGLFYGIAIYQIK